MIAYHGSNHCFKTLRIHKSLIRSLGTELNEGMGIYFSLDKSIAASYGKYVYTLDINNKYLKDFRQKSECAKYLLQVRKDIRDKCGVDIGKYLDLGTITNYMYSGGITISGVCREIYLMLDSNSRWYEEVSTSNIEKVHRELNKYDKENQCAYLFNYSIQKIGILRKISNDIVRIINRESVR